MRVSGAALRGLGVRATGWWWRQTVWDRLFWLSLAVAAGIVCATFPDYGITTDEPLHVEYGKRALAWYLSLGHDRTVLGFQNLYLYGALYDTPVAIAEALLPFDLYATRRLVGGLVGLLGILAVWRIGRDLARFSGTGRSGSPRQVGRAGLAAAWCLMLTPDWWGHSFSNPKDVPFAVAVAWTLSWLVRAAQEMPTPRRRTVVWLGVCLGCALGIRVGGVVLLGVIAVVPLGWVLGRAARAAAQEQAAQEQAAWGRFKAWASRERVWGIACDVWATVRRFWPMPVIAYGVMLAAWPWAQTSPLTHPLEALAEFSKFPLDFTFVFAGVTVRTTDLPWWYLPVGFAVKLPEVVVAALVAGAGLAALRWRRARRVRLDVLAVATAIVLPPALVIATHAVLYDGIRHMTFLLPPLAVAAGFSIDRMARLLPRLGRGVMAAALLLNAAFQVMAMARLHPYETIWFNQFVGGVAGAQGRFELDYWGSALSEAARRLTAAVVAMDGASALDQAYHVRVCGPPTNAFYYLPPAWKPSRRASGPVDFYLSFTREACKGEPDGPDIVLVEREGAPLAYARDLRVPGTGSGPPPPVPPP